MELDRSKFVTPEVAAERAVRSGDWVDYGFGGGYPELMDRALAARKGRLTDVKIRGGLVIRPRIEVVECDPEQISFHYYSWHLGDYERKLQAPWPGPVPAHDPALPALPLPGPAHPLRHGICPRLSAG